MNEELKIEIGKRLADLRKNSSRVLHTQKSLAEELKPQRKNKTTGKQTISRLENGKIVLTSEMALKYSSIYKVSLDYLYGIKQENWWEQLGLSNATITKLEDMNINEESSLVVLDHLINPKNNTSFIEFLEALNEHSLLNDETMKPEESEYQSLYKITKIAEKMANELRNDFGG